MVSNNKMLSLGLVAGLLVATRYQDTVLILPFFIWLLINYRVKVFFFIITAFLAFLPQLLAWQILNGSFWQVSYLADKGAGSFSFLPWHFFQVLFSRRHGLFFWTPLLLLSLWGLRYFRDKQLTKFLLAGFVLEAVVTSAWSQWWQGNSFGGRFFISSLPLFYFGLISLLQQYKFKVAPFMALAVFYNLLLFILFILKVVQ